MGNKVEAHVFPRFFCGTHHRVPPFHLFHPICTMDEIEQPKARGRSMFPSLGAIHIFPIDPISMPFRRPHGPRL
jgi:hypothetical protein